MVRWRELPTLSVFAVGAALLKRRWRIVGCAVAGGLVVAALVFNRPAVYVASASFVPQANDAGRSSLASLAGQFGVALPTGGQSQSPEFYAQLLRSRTILSAVARDTFAVTEKGGRRLPFDSLFPVPDGAAGRREAEAVRLLGDMVQANVNKATGVVSVSIATKWPSVSLAIVQALLDGVNEYNQRTRQGQAGAERKFVESRLRFAADDLRSAEDRLEAFLQTNRSFGNYSELSFQRDRLQREVGLRQQVVTALTQSYEDARIREVRDTPVITLVDTPTLPVIPQARGRVKSVVVGAFLGAVIGMAVIILALLLEQRRSNGDAEVQRLLSALSELKNSALQPMRRARKGLGEAINQP